jgi:hypothetical protein
MMRLASTLAATLVAGANAASRPNIVVIVADDLGWRDVGFSGSNISTPHIDKFASEGVRLTGLYGQPVCSPSRAALHTGRYPISYGLQTYVIDPAGVDYGLNLNETLMPELFKTYGGYQTHVSLCVVCVARCGAAYKCSIPHLPVPSFPHLPVPPLRPLPSLPSRPPSSSSSSSSSFAGLRQVSRFARPR